MIREKAQKGKSAYAIGKELGISKNTAKKYMNQPRAEHGLKGRKKPSKLDPFKPEIHEMLKSGIFKDVNMVGGLSIHPAGRVNFLWVDPGFRNKGIGGGLINHAVRELNLQKLAISFPGNASLTGFVERLGFMKDPITQYEMYLPIIRKGSL